MLGTILLALDRWPESRPALDTARALALSSKAEVVVLHVREHHHARSTVVEPGLPGDAQELVDCAVYELARCGIRARGLLRQAPLGRVPEKIVEVAGAEGANLIVVGSRGQSCLRALLAWSVPHRLIRLADRPVVLAPDGRRRSRSATSPKEAQRYLT
jgi:nucleotide-binding universal stress UspA family protein